LYAADIYRQMKLRRGSSVCYSAGTELCYGPELHPSLAGGMHLTTFTNCWDPDEMSSYLLSHAGLNCLPLESFTCRKSWKWHQV